MTGEKRNRLESVLNVMDSALFLRIAAPPFALIFSHIQIGNKHIAQRIIIGIFYDLLTADCITQVIQPCADSMNGFLQRGQQCIQADDLSVFIAVFTANTFTFQRGSGWAKMLLRQTIFNSLPFKGTHINTFHPSGCFERRILCCCPILPPDFAVLLFVPINGVDLDTFPTSIWGTDAVPAFIERVNIL